MRKFYASFILFLTISICFLSCKNSGKKHLSENQIDSVRTSFKMTSDSLELYWDVMITDDNLKMVEINGLLVEMQNTGQYDQTKLDSLIADLQNLKASRYDQQSMAISEKIDAYDYGTSDIINKVFVYAKSKPVFDNNPAMKSIEYDIAKSQEMVLSYRIGYDRWAKLINLQIAENKEYLDIDTSLLKPRPLFELSE